MRSINNEEGGHRRNNSHYDPQLNSSRQLNPTNPINLDPFGETHNAESLKLPPNMMFGMTSTAANGLNFGASLSPAH